MPRVTVLLAVKDGADELPAAVDGILGQTFEDFELLVVDDGSSDGSGTVAASTGDPRIVVHRLDENVGLTRALNVGLELARGELVARHDADDRSRPERLERQVAFLDANPDVALCATWVALGQPTRRRAYDVAELRRELERRNVLVHGTIMFRHAAVEAVVGYRDAFRYAQDYDLYLRLLPEHELALLPEELYDFRLGGGLSEAAFERQTLFAEVARTLYRQRLERGDDDLARGVSIDDLLQLARPSLGDPALLRQRARFALARGERLQAFRLFARSLRR